MLRTAALLYCLLNIAFGVLPWVGNFNDYTSTTQMDASTPGSPTGQYLCYIYGQVPSSNKFSTWVELDPSYKNPGECIGNKGVKVTIDGTSIWQGNSVLRRLEFIANFPGSDQTGTIYYKWSMMQSGTFTMSQYEHQLVFFENHPCDLKYGGSGGANLWFNINGRSVWNTPFTANTWYNFGLQVDYSAKTCTIYHSTGSNALAQVVAATSAPGIAPSDFHLGILRVTTASDTSTTKQSIFYSGVYAERTLTNNLGAACGTPVATSAVVRTSAGTPPPPTSAGTPPSPNTPPATGPGGKATVVIITYGDASSLLPLVMVLTFLLAMLL
jgi:hypothetical protein